MARLSPLLAIALLTCMVASSSAQAAAGVGQRRAVAQPVPSSQPATASSTLIASQAACPGQDDPGAPVAVQEEAMLCMTNFARQGLGLATLSAAPELDGSAAAKANDLLECDNFSHTACGRDFTFWMRESGYIGEFCWHVGENLAWGSGEYGSVRSIFQAWMRSPTHRHNIVGDYSQLGIGLEVGELAGEAGVHVWTQHFGSRCEPAPAVS